MRSRRGLGVLVACGLALGMMAIGASGAQAGRWMVSSANVKAGVELEVSFEVAIVPLGEKKHLVILTSNGIEFLCGKGGNSNATFTSEVLTEVLNFSECRTFFKEKEMSGCSPINQPIAIGGSARAVLDKEKSYEKIVGVGGTLATLEFNEESCALSPVLTLTGTLWLEDSNNQFEVEKVTHLFQEARIPALELGGMHLGSAEVAIDGWFTQSLSDAPHIGQTFSGLAE